MEASYLEARAQILSRPRRASYPARRSNDAGPPPIGPRCPARGPRPSGRLAPRGGHRRPPAPAVDEAGPHVPTARITRTCDPAMAVAADTAPGARAGRPMRARERAPEGALLVWPAGSEPASPPRPATRSPLKEEHCARTDGPETSPALPRHAAASTSWPTRPCPPPLRAPTRVASWPRRMTPSASLLARRSPRYAPQSPGPSCMRCCSECAAARGASDEREGQLRDAIAGPGCAGTRSGGRRPVPDPQPLRR